MSHPKDLLGYVLSSLAGKRLDIELPAGSSSRVTPCLAGPQYGGILSPYSVDECRFPGVTARAIGFSHSALGTVLGMYIQS